MRFLLAVLAVNFALAVANEGISPRKCCNNEHNVIVNNKCVPDENGNITQITLKCQSKFVLDPSEFEEDNYNVTANGTLHVYDYESDIASDE